MMNILVVVLYGVVILVTE